MIKNEQCDAGSEEGCNEDCSSNLPDFICKAGNETTPSICSRAPNSSAN